MLAIAGFAILLLIGLTGGVGGALMMLGLGGLAAGLFALVRGRSAVFRIRSRLMAVAALGVALVVFIGGTTAFAAQHPTPPAQLDMAAPASSVEPVPHTKTATLQPAARQTPSATPARGTALHLLATLPIKGRAPMTGYARTADFGAAWIDVDRNGCDTRNDVLRRDLVDVAAGGCIVRSGVLADPYTGKTIDFVRGQTTSTKVQIDHVVSLGDAWQTGAQKLSFAKRVDLANDPINLFAVDGPTNEAKGDGDTATWLPPNKSFRCVYVAHQIGVKAAYGLWVTQAEHDAMARVLSGCPSVDAPSSVTSGLVPPVAAPAPKPAPVTHAPVASTPSVYYANCDAVRAAGKAPLHRGDAGYRSALDRDGDGIACESTSSTSSSSSSSSRSSTSSGSGNSGSSAPSGATARCRDGSYSYSQHHSGTCSHHGGVATWL